MFSIKFIIVSILILILIIYIYLFNTNDKTKNKKVDIITDKNIINFNQKIRKNCNNDDCYLSIHLVNYVVKMIKKNGLKNTINYLRNNRNKFVLDSGEYVFINTKYKKNNEDRDFYLYHHHKFLDNKDTIDAQKSLNENTNCTTEDCDVAGVMDGITDFADKHESGFHEFKWFDPKTKKIIFKRTFIRKIKKLNDTGIGLESKDFIISVKLNIDIFLLLFI